MRLVKLVLATLGLAVAIPAHAAEPLGTEIQATAINYIGGGTYGGIHLTNQFDDRGPAGRFDFSGNVVGSNAPFNALTWCVDIFRGVNENGIYTLSSLSAANLRQNLNDTRLAQLAGLVTHADDVFGLIDPNNSELLRTTGAAFQLAVWELVYEADGNPFNVSTNNGSFWAYDTQIDGTNFSSLFGQANGYLANVQNSIWTASVSDVTLLYSENDQTQIFSTPTAAVPEPGTWMTMILGFGFAGAMVRRSRKSGAKAALTA